MVLPGSLVILLLIIFGYSYFNAVNTAGVYTEDVAVLLTEDTRSLLKIGFDLKKYDSSKGSFRKSDYKTSNDLSSLLSSTFLGGRSMDGYPEVPSAIDNDGNIYVASRTYSNNFPVTDGAYSENMSMSYDIFVTKINPDLSAVLASTYIGGSAEDGLWAGLSLALDDNGNVYVAGQTASSNYPTSENAFDQTYNGSNDIFISKFDPDLTELLASTYIGGSGEEVFARIAVGSRGDVYIAGSTSSSDFPVTSGVIDESYNPGGDRGWDLFVAKLDSNLTALQASTYIGGNNNDCIEALVLDDDDNAYICGWTASRNYPTTPGVVAQNYNGGSYDAFVSVIDSDLSELTASTFFGGSAWDFGYCLALDNNDNIYLSGHTASTGLPTTQNAYDRSYNGVGGEDNGDDVYIAKFNNSLTQLLASSYLGGSEWENSSAIIIGTDDNIIVTGSTSSSDFPTAGEYISDTYKGGNKYQGDVFITVMDNSMSEILFSSYFGGEENEGAGSVIIGFEGNFYIAGSTGSSDFPVTSRAFDDSYNGGGFDWGGDVFISKFGRDMISGTTPVESADDLIPHKLGLYENYPNPFNPETTIRYGVENYSFIRMSIYDIRGRFVRTIKSEYHLPGEYSIEWDGKNSDGIYVGSGVYFCRLSDRKRVLVKKMLLLR
ncbi:SBBP repeat-containing protein [candidate division KSB1 bacterium]